MTLSRTHRLGWQFAVARRMIICLALANSAFAADDPFAANASADSNALNAVTQVPEKTSAINAPESPSSSPGSLTPKTDSTSTSQAAVITAIESAEQRVIHRSGGDQAQPKEPQATEREKPFAAPSGWRSLLALTAVLSLIGLAALAARRMLLKSRKVAHIKMVDVIARTSIGSRQSLCLVRLADRLLLVGLSPNHMAALDVIEDPDTVARVMGDVARHAPDASSVAFKKLFQRESREFNFTEVAPDEGDVSTPVTDPALMADTGWCRARGELTGLLNKVKGLSRLHWH